MNKTPVKESAPQAGRHMPARQIYPIVATSPWPGPQNCTGFTASGTIDSDIISIEVDLVVSGPSHTTRLIQGTPNVPGDGTWSCPFAGQFPLQTDAYNDTYMPALLIVRGRTAQGGTVILNVPFSHDPAAARPPL